MILDVVEALSELIAIPSVSPMGLEASGPTVGEARLTDHLEKLFLQIGLAVYRQPVASGRENIIAKLEGDVPATQGGGVVLLDAHQDTVQADNMTIEPFQPAQRDGRIYGRGACDTKGGMAAILAAVARLAHQRPRQRPTIIVACTVDEENGFRGASRLVDLWADDCCEFIPRRPDAAIVLEPTALDVVVAHKGVIRWRVHTHGRAAHSAKPTEGENAIYRMARTVTAIEQYAAALGANGDVHPLCGVPTMSVGTIHGGVGVNTVPDRCTIEIDCRPLPGDDLNHARQRLIDHIRHTTTPAEWLEHEPPFMQGGALSDQHNRSLARRLSATIQQTVSSCRHLGVSYCTNAPFYAAAGVPAVVFGPGFIEQAHTADEWVPIDQLHHATEILYQFCAGFTAR